MYTSTLKSYNVDANLDASDNVFSGNEPSLKMLTSQRQKLEWAEQFMPKYLIRNKIYLTIWYGIFNCFQ